MLSPLKSILPFLESFFAFKEGSLIPVDGDIDTNIDQSKLSKLINSKLSNVLWCDYGEIVGTTGNKQLDLLGHPNEPLLLVKHENTSDSTIYCFKFIPNTGDETIVYGRDQKRLIEIIIKLWLPDFANQTSQQENNSEKYFQICKNQVLKINYLNDELTKRNFETEKLLNGLFQYFLKDELTISEKISLSDSAIDYLKTFPGTFQEMEKMAKDAFYIAKSLCPSSTEIRIKKYYFIPPEAENRLNISNAEPGEVQIEKPKAVKNVLKAPDKPLPISVSGTKNDKTIQLLNRYEVAVKKLLEQKLPVMGKNIASACEPPISAPALTDSINKHRDRIISCLENHPDKWQLLKNNYQVIKKLDS